MARSVDFQSLACIRGARRGETTRRGSAGEGVLVAVDQGEQPVTDSAGRALAMASASRDVSNASSADDRGAAAGWAPIRYQPGGNEACPTTTRRRRRKRLRTTAAPTARLTANATLGGVASGSRRKVHHSTPARVRRPSRAKRANALRSRMRQIKRTGCAGPWRGVPSARPARRGCSSGDGSRASWRGDDCSVGRCASRNPPRRRMTMRSSSIAAQTAPRYAATTRPYLVQLARLRRRGPA